MSATPKLYTILGDAIKVYEVYETIEEREKADQQTKKWKRSTLPHGYILIDTRIKEADGKIAGVGAIGNNLEEGIMPIGVTKEYLKLWCRRVSRITMQKRWRKALFDAHGIHMLRGFVFDKEEAFDGDDLPNRPPIVYGTFVRTHREPPC